MNCHRYINYSRIYDLAEKSREFRSTSNQITSKGAWSLARILTNSKILRDMSLWNNHLSDANAIDIVNVLLTNKYSLKIMNRGQNEITDVVLEELTPILRKKLNMNRIVRDR